ncbi:MAG: outer membrane lipid asymmetry maintenance protein MlaD [Parvibaculaceae bacterium]
MKTNLVETVVGAVVILIAAAFFSFAYSTSGIGKGSGGVKLSAEFENAAGINIGSDVRMSGVKIGTVTDQSLNPENFQAVVTFSVNPEVPIPDDSTAKITSEGILGSNFVAIEPGGSETKLKDGERMAYTQGAIDIWSLVSQYMFSSGTKKDEGSENKESEPPANAQEPAPAPEQPAPTPQP